MGLTQTLQGIAPGTHACSFHATGFEYRQTVAAFVRLGLERRERVMCIAAESPPSLLREALESEGIDTGRLIAAGALRLVTLEEALSGGGPCDPVAAAHWLGDEEADALGSGYLALRVSLDMSWALQPVYRGGDLLALEDALTTHIPGSKTLQLCHYDRSLFTPEQILTALDSHTLAIMGSGIVRRPSPRPTEAPPRVDSGEATGGKRLAPAQGDMAPENTQLFLTLADTAPVMIWICDPSGARTFFNQAWLTFTGRRFEEELGAGWAAGIHREDMDRCMATFLAALKARRPFEMDYRLRRADGLFRWVMDRGAPHFGPDGTFLGFVGSAVDITERRDFESVLKRGKEEWEAAFDAIPDPVFLASVDGRVLRCNRAATERLDLPFGLIVDSPLGRLVGCPEVDERLHPVAQPSPDREMPQNDLFCPGLRGWFRISAYPFPSGEDAAGRVISVFRDVSQHRRIEDTLLFLSQRSWIESGENFFVSLARYLGEALDVDHVIVSKLFSGLEEAETVALYARGQIIPNLRYALRDTPCEDVAGKKSCCHPEGAQQAYPRDSLLAAMSVESFMGFPLWDSTGAPLGMIAVMDGKPMKDPAAISEIVQLTATSASAEMERARTEEVLRRSEERWRSVLETIEDGFYEVDLAGNFTAFNPAMAGILGYAAHEMTGMNNRQYMSPEAAKEVYETYNRVFTTGRPERAIGRTLFSKSGKRRFIEASISLVKSPGDGFEGFRGIVRDVTERKRAEDILLARFRLSERSASGTLEDLLRATLDEAELLTESTMGFCHFLEPDQMTLSFQTWSTNTKVNLCKAEGKGRHHDMERAGVWADAVRERRPVVHNDYASLPNRGGLPEGHPPVTRDLVVPVFRGGQIVALFGVGNKAALYDDDDLQTMSQLATLAWDVAERKRAEETLRENRRQLQLITDEAPVFLARCGPDERYLFVNRQYAEILGRRAEDIVGRHPREILGEEAYAQASQHISAALAGHRAEYDFVLHRPSSEIRTFHAIYSPEFDNAGRPCGFVVATTDISIRKAAEEALSASEDYLRTIVQNEPECVKLMDCEGRILDMNASGLAMLEADALEQVKGKQASSLIVEEDRAAFEEMVAGVFAGEARQVVFDVVGLHGTRRTLESHTVPLWTSTEPRAVKALLGVTRDITAARKMALALEESERRFRTLLESVDLIAVVLDREGAIGFSNAYLLRLSGWSEEEITGKNWFDHFLRGDDREAVVTMFRNAMQTGNLPVSYENEIVTRHGERRLIRWSNSMLRDSAGAPLGAASIGEDITEWRRASDALKASQEKFQRLVEVTSDWVWEIDEEGRYTYASPRIFDLLGYTPKEILGTSPFDLMPPEEAARVGSEFKPIFDGRKPFAFLENTNMRKDGGTVVLETSGIPIFDGEGRFRGYHGIDRDVTAKINSERERRHLVTAIDQAAEVVLLTDPEGKILYANPAFERTTGYTREEALGQIPNILKSGSHAEDYYEEMWNALLRREVWRGHLTNRRKDGSLYQEEATISPVEDTQGHLTGFVAVMRDISEEEALRETLSKAREMERLGHLVGGVAHEVRNPLNAIQAATEALQLDLGTDPNFQPLFNIIRGQVNRMSILMEELLELGKPLQPSRLEGLSLVQACEAAVTVLRESRPKLDPSRLQLIHGGKEDPKIWADSAKLQQVLLNLLDNAANSSPQRGTITLLIQGGEVHHCVKVIDEGTGIDPHHLSRVFEPFFTTRKGGTGLGLSLVRHIVEAHGGSVALLNNQPPPGCTAEVTLPAWDESRAAGMKNETGSPPPSGPR